MTLLVEGGKGWGGGPLREQKFQRCCLPALLSRSGSSASAAGRRGEDRRPVLWAARAQLSEGIGTEWRVVWGDGRVLVPGDAAPLGKTRTHTRAHLAQPPSPWCPEDRVIRVFMPLPSVSRLSLQERVCSVGSAPRNPSVLTFSAWRKPPRCPR